MLSASSSFSSTALLSFYAWLDHYLLQQGQHYINANTQLYPQPTDSVLGSSFTSYAAPFRSIVWDTSISGANQFVSVSGYTFNTGAFTNSGGDQLYTSVLFPQIQTTGYGTTLQVDFSFPAYITLPSGGALLSGNSVFFDDRSTVTGAVRLSGVNSGSYTDVTFRFSGTPTVITGGQYGLVLDYENGRVILPQGTLATSTLISGSYAMKEFNIYFANQSMDGITFMDKPYLNSRFNRALTGMPAPHEMTTPCIFISSSRARNEQKALGGLYDTTLDMRCTIYAETLSQLQGSLSLIRDAKDLCFPAITPAQWPLQPSGSLKAAGYNYETLAASISGNPFSITKVRAFKGSDNVSVNRNLFVGHVDLTLQRTRTLS